MTERYRIDHLRIRQPPLGSGFPDLGGEALETGGWGDLQRPQRLITHQEVVWQARRRTPATVRLPPVSTPPALTVTRFPRNQKAVAAEAGVARPTVFAAFGSKAALLRQVLDQALAGDDEPVPVAQRPWFQPVWDATAPPEVVDAYAAVCTLIGARAARIFDEHTSQLWLAARMREVALSPY